MITLNLFIFFATTLTLPHVVPIPYAYNEAKTSPYNENTYEAGLYLGLISYADREAETPTYSKNTNSTRLTIRCTCVSLQPDNPSKFRLLKDLKHNSNQNKNNTSPSY